MTTALKRTYWWLARQLGLTKPPTDPKQIFSAIYHDGTWGKGEDFFSGEGSHEPGIVEPYVATVRNFLQSLGSLPDVVDIGCGDFHVGSQLVGSARRYVACDIVPDLVERNRRKFTVPNLRFEVVNAIDDPLPEGDVVFLRQVLQHMSNEHIQAVLPKLARYRHWVVTEHLPADADFLPNADKRTGGDVRLMKSKSGVVLTAPPFNVQPRRSTVLCEVSSPSGGQPAVIRTVVYEFQAEPAH
jgi:hypothetical protein